ncbi:hypothetical protein H072_7707 [Dactylellina haptotyla CBS 200.50]|uniref:Uncharacterized protein n=1 Tax=Dactylellina haptotyla (strain CBS 200.50) TaxID=1284197 RepID=S8A6V9_DACHA|nr:hypothetical protein H072_7707 [Dactylellina haptotyla CBS 200.50]
MTGCFQPGAEENPAKSTGQYWSFAVALPFCSLPCQNLGVDPPSSWPIPSPPVLLLHRVREDDGFSNQNSSFHTTFCSRDLKESVEQDNVGRAMSVTLAYQLLKMPFSSVYEI